MNMNRVVSFKTPVTTHVSADMSAHPSKLESFLLNTVCLQMNGAVSKVNKKFIFHLTRTKRTPSAAAKF